MRETIESVLGQDYPNLEYIIIDGGSSDGSVEMIREYADKLAYWVSEPDRGQTHAINKGLERMTGEVWSYLNSDDLLLPGALEHVADAMADPDLQFFGGISDVFDQDGSRGFIEPTTANCLREYLSPWNRGQRYLFPCSNVSFMRRSLIDRVGNFDESYDFCMDTEYNVRAVFLADVRPQFSTEMLGRWRWHKGSKTFRQGLWYGFRQEQVRIASTYLNRLSETDQRQVAREITEQKRSVAVRKASFSRHQGRLGSSFRQLIGAAASDPALFFDRFWLGTLARVSLLRRGTLALEQTCSKDTHPPLC